MFHTSYTFIAYEKSTILFGEISVEKVYDVENIWCRKWEISVEKLYDVEIKK